MYVFSFYREREVWKPKSSLLPSSASLAQQQHLGQNLEDDYNDKYEEAEDTEKPLETAKTFTRLKLSTTKTSQQQAPEQQELSESEHEPHLHQLQQPQQNSLASNPLEPISKAWFFKNGEYYPKPAKVHKKRRGKKAHLQGSKLFPFQDPHSDRIVNQLMYVPPNYEEIKTSGKFKTILLYNGLGPWNIKAGWLSN